MSSSNPLKTFQPTSKGTHNKSNIPYTQLSQPSDAEVTVNTPSELSNPTETPKLDFQSTFAIEKDIETQLSKYFDAFKFILLVFLGLDIWLAIASEIYYVYVGIDVLSVLIAFYGLFLRSACHVKLFVWMNFALWLSVDIYLIVVASRIKSSLDLIHFLAYSLMFGFVYNVLRFAIWIDASKLRNMLAVRTSQENTSNKTETSEKSDRNGHSKKNGKNEKDGNDIQLDEITWK